MFTKYGYQETTVEEIALEAGITKPVIYDHFGSKEGLMSAVITRARDQLGEATRNAFNDLPADFRAEDFLRRAFLVFFTFIDEYRASFELLRQEGNLTKTPGVERIRTQQAQLMSASLAASRELADVDPGLMAAFGEMIVGASERYAIYRIDTAPNTPEEATEEIMAMVWSGISASAKQG